MHFVLLNPVKGRAVQSSKGIEREIVMRTSTTLALLAGLVFSAAALNAGETTDTGNAPEHKGGHGKFRAMILKKFDTNGDGKLDETERAAAKAWIQEHRGEHGGKGGNGEHNGEFRQKLLEKFDTNGDGKLDDNEKAAMKEAFKAHLQNGANKTE